MKKRINKCLKRALATTMVASMTMSALSLSSSAYSGLVGNNVNWSKADVFTSSDGTRTVTVKTGSNAEWDEIIHRQEEITTKNVEDGQVVESFESKIVNVVASSSDAEYSYEEGESKRTVLKYEYPEVTVQLLEGKKAVGKSASINPITKGDFQNGSNDPEYDWTRTSETQRVVTASMSNAKTSLGNDSHQIIEKPIVPSYVSEYYPIYNSKKDVFRPYGYDENDMFSSYWRDVQKPMGYDFQFVGFGEVSVYRFVEEEEHIDSLNEDYGNDIIHFRLADMSSVSANTEPPYTYDDKVIHTAYCVEHGTGTQKGFWYKIDNLESKTYYTDSEAENHIRAIVNNGYWGTENEESVYGSLAKLKAKLKEDKDNPLKQEILKDLSVEAIDQLTEGEALVATQLAIWKYANHGEKAFVSTYANNYRYHATDDVKTRIYGVAEYLASLSEKATIENSTPIINENKFIDKMAVTVGDYNEDGTYDISLSLKMAITPDGDNDDLVLSIKNGNYVKYARLAGDNSEDNIDFLDVKNNGNGEYEVSGLELKTGNVSLELSLVGTQKLKRGVYVYTSEERVAYDGEGNPKYDEDGNLIKTSQTFVSVAEGKNQVDVVKTVEFKFEVTEKKLITEHFWRNEELNTYNEEESESSSEDESSSESETETSTSTTASEETTTVSEETTTAFEETTTASEETTLAQTTPAETTSGRNNNDDDEPRTTAPTTTAVETTAPETTAPVSTVPETVAPETVVYRGVEIPKEILDQYPDKTLDELYDMGVLGEYFEKVPTGLLPATSDATIIWTALSVLSGLGLAGTCVIGRRREDEE